MGARARNWKQERECIWKKNDTPYFQKEQDPIITDNILISTYIWLLSQLWKNLYVLAEVPFEFHTELNGQLKYK